MATYKYMYMYLAIPTPRPLLGTLQATVTGTTFASSIYPCLKCNPSISQTKPYRSQYTRQKLFSPPSKSQCYSSNEGEHNPAPELNQIGPVIAKSVKKVDTEYLDMLERTG